MTRGELQHKITLHRSKEIESERVALVSFFSGLALSSAGISAELSVKDPRAGIALGIGALASFAVSGIYGTGVESSRQQATTLEAAQYIVNGPDPEFEPAHEGDRTGQ